MEMLQTYLSTLLTFSFSRFLVKFVHSDPFYVIIWGYVTLVFLSKVSYGKIKKATHIFSLEPCWNMARCRLLNSVAAVAASDSKEGKNLPHMLKDCVARKTFVAQRCALSSKKLKANYQIKMRL